MSIMDSIESSQPSSSQSLSSLPSSQSVSSQVGQKKNPSELDWIHMLTVDEDECFYMMSRGQYKMTCTHNGYIWNCTVHTNSDSHKMEVSYFRCSSKNCIQNPDDKCPFRHSVRKCLKENLYYIFMVI